MYFENDLMKRNVKEKKRHKNLKLETDLKFKSMTNLLIIKQI
jgi:hypothetical protein